MSDVFEVVPSYDDRTRVPFRVPRKGQESLEFTIPRMSYLPEEVARQMKEDLQAIDKHVQQHDLNGEPIWRVDRDGNDMVGDDGEKVPFLGPPQRTVLERTREVALTMLGCVCDAETLAELKKLTVGELDQILGHWTKVSESPLEASLGESTASSTS